MESKRTATTYFIPPGKFLLMENALGNPDLIQSSVSSDCRVTIVDLENFPLDDLEQWPTFRLISSDIKLKLGEGKYHIYIVVPAADNTESTSAFVSYNTRLVDRKGYAQDGTLLGKAGFRYYPCGTVSERGGNPSATTTPSGQGRVVEMDLGVTPTITNLPGNFSDLEEVFHIEKTDPSNPSSWLMTIVGTVKSMTARIIRVTSSLIFGSGENERPLVGVAVRKDATTPGMVSDTIIATTAWVDAQFEHMDDRYLSKQKDDRSTGTIASDKGFEAGKFVQEASGAACYQDEDGNWHIETDHLRVRKKTTFTEIEVQEVHHVGGQMLLTSADMIVEFVCEMEDRYRCYFRKVDSDGREIENLWQAGDQAYCNTFNLTKQADGTLGNHYLWRLVIGTNLDTKYDVDTLTFGDITINTAEYNFTDLSKEVCAVDSDTPIAKDKIVSLGYQYDDDPDRQNALILAGAGAGSPYFYEFTGINSFHLPEPETRIKPGDNLFSGVMRIKGGSTGAKNLEDFPEEVFKAVHIGAVNLLLNSGFTGDYKAEELNASYALDSGSELFSRGMKHWIGNATINDDTASVSGKCAAIGSLSQSVQLMKDEGYVVSFKAKGASVKIMLGGLSVEQVLGADYTSYSFKFVSDGVGSFSISGDATICDLQLERGTIATDWHASPYDNDKTLAEFQALKYIQDSIREGDTTILGGLILSSMIQLGNYKDGKMKKVNAGMSGIYNDDDDVAFWGGGTFEQAIATVMKFKQNPNYMPTDAEWRDLANFVVSHGGDLIIRGYIYALGGYFRGEINAESGVFKNVKSPNGSFLIDELGNVKIIGTFETSVNGTRIKIDAETNQIVLYDDLGRETAVMNFYKDVGEIWTYGTMQFTRYERDSNVVANKCVVDPTKVAIIDNLLKYESVYRSGFAQMFSTDGKNALITLAMKKEYTSTTPNSDYNWITNLQMSNLPKSASEVAIGGVYNDGGVLKIKN